MKYATILCEMLIIHVIIQPLGIVLAALDRNQDEILLPGSEQPRAMQSRDETNIKI